jgi:hypothetical protein
MLLKHPEQLMMLQLPSAQVRPQRLASWKLISAQIMPDDAMAYSLLLIIRKLPQFEAARHCAFNARRQHA